MPARMAPLDEWHIEPTQVLVNERAMTVLVGFRGIGERHRVRIDMSGFHFLRLDADGERVVEAWGFVEDQDALDKFFGAEPA
ncbi:MAG: hypothetical protein H0W01_09425 [Pseudonocardiales bacterium]|nr:hypothetical protein [Pseudonocardiales bacterium]